MAFSTDFPGNALPDGWTFQSALGDGSVSVSNSRLVIDCPSNVTHDSVFNTSSADNSVGVITALPSHGGNIDIAIQCDTDVSDRRGQGVNLLIIGATNADFCRFSWFKNTSNGYGPNLFGYSRAGGSGAAFGNTGIATFQSGIPSWLRISYVASTGTWTALHSADGVNWIVHMTGVRSFAAQSFKIGVTSVSSRPTVPVRINRAIDMLNTNGVTDVRDQLPSYTTNTIATIVGSEGVLPAGFVNSSNGTSVLTLTGTALRLDHDAAQNNTPITGGKFKSALEWTGTKYLYSGLLFKVIQVDGGNSACYLTPSLAYSQVGAPWDQYIMSGGYGQEIQSGSIRRPIRIDNPFESNVVVDSYPTGLDETPYCWLADLTTSNIRDNAARWFRMERIGKRFRSKEWLDGSAEPAEWNLFDGQDQVEDEDLLGPYISLSHNGNDKTGTCVFDITNLEFYEIVLDSYKPVRLGSLTKALRLGAAEVQVR